MKKVGLVFSLIALMFFMALSIPTRVVFAQSDDIVVFNYDSLARYNPTIDESIMSSRDVFGTYYRIFPYQFLDGSTTSFTLYFNFYTETVYTPNGTDVSLPSGTDPREYLVCKYLNDLPTNVRNDIIARNSVGYNLIQTDGSPTTSYNCHSFAWYSQNISTNDTWISFPTAYYIDDSYESVDDPRVGDIVCYYDNKGTPNDLTDDDNLHSGIIVGLSGESSNGNCGNVNMYNVKSKWGMEGLYTHKGDECPYTSSHGGDADYVMYYRPRTNASYTLSNYSSTINESLTIDSSTQLIDKYEMYELNVNYTKNYEFKIQANDLLDVRLYDEHMQLVSFNDLNNNSHNVHFIKTLQNTKTYYLRVSYDDGESTGTISTQIASRTTAYLSYNTQNDILLNTYNGIHDYYYINDRGAGFYKFKLTGTNIDGTTFTYPANAIKIYNDTPKNSSNLLEKYSLTGYTNHAQNKNCEDSFIVCLPRNGYFYLDVNVPSTNLASLTIEVLPLYNEEIDLFDLSESSNTYLPIMSSSIKGDYFEALELNQTGKFVINATYEGSQTDDILFVLAEKAYNASTNSYYINPISVYLMDNYYNSYSITRALTEGTYYIGYFNKDDTSNFSVSLTRLVTQSGANALLVDHGSDWDCGSQINIIEMYSSNKSYNSTNITEGFTRIIYMNEPLGLSGSRLDYYWYSSNESIATVTNYGTVLGRNAGTVKIMAVLKEDPSKVFVKQFTIIEDDGTGYTPVESNYTIKYSDTDNGTFHLELEDVLCPYPWYQYYTWSTYVPCQFEEPSVTNDIWGNYTVSGPGTFDLTGQFYIYNTVYITVVVIIHVIITDN